MKVIDEDILPLMMYGAVKHSSKLETVCTPFYYSTAHSVCGRCFYRLTPVVVYEHTFVTRFKLNLLLFLECEKSRTVNLFGLSPSICYCITVQIYLSIYIYINIYIYIIKYRKSVLMNFDRKKNTLIISLI